MDDMEQICCSTCKWLKDLPFKDYYCCMNEDNGNRVFPILFPNGERCNKWEKEVKDEKQS